MGRTRFALGRIRDFTRSGRAENNSLALRQILGRSLCSPAHLWWAFRPSARFIGAASNFALSDPPGF